MRLLAQTSKPPRRTAILVNGHTIRIQFPFNWDVLNAVKAIPGRKFHSNKTTAKYWTAPLSIDAVETLKKSGFELDASLLTFLATAPPPVDSTAELDVPGLQKTLFPFQRQAVAFLEARNGRALIADEMGVGKTIQTLAWLHLHPEKRPIIIVCPASVKYNWKREIEKTLPEEASIAVLSGTTPYRLKAEFLIINYDLLRYWWKRLRQMQPQVLVLDEAHYIKTATTQRTKATQKLAATIPHVIGLTGTPVVSRPIECYNAIQLIDPTVFPDFWTYARRYCNAKRGFRGWDFSGAANEDELHQKLTQTIMLRRLKADVLPDLPPKMRSYIPLEINNRDEYDSADEDVIQYIREEKGELAAESAKKAEHLVKFEKLRQLATEGKLPQAIEWIKNFLSSSDEKLVVFAVHTATIDTLMNAFDGTAVRVDGSVPTTKRHKAVTTFQKQADCRLFIGNVQAAGTGLTLTSAASVAFLELPWTPGDLTQAEDRVHRIGQTCMTNIYYLLAAGTVEQEIVSLIDAKKKVFSTVVDGRTADKTSLLKELIKIYREKKEGKKPC